VPPSLGPGLPSYGLTTVSKYWLDGKEGASSSCSPVFELDTRFEALAAELAYEAQPP
jgi:hypothetical protein